MIKQLLLAGTATVVVAGGGVVAANHYEKYQNKQHKAQVTLAEQAKQAQYKADLTQQQALQKTTDTLRAECQKGELAYAKLPLYVQKVVSKPVCN